MSNKIRENIIACLVGTFFSVVIFIGGVYFSEDIKNVSSVNLSKKTTVDPAQARMTAMLAAAMYCGPAWNNNTSPFTKKSLLPKCDPRFESLKFELFLLRD
jgi:hypothetical protein